MEEWPGTRARAPEVLNRLCRVALSNRTGIVGEVGDGQVSTGSQVAAAALLNLNIHFHLLLLDGVDVLGEGAARAYSLVRPRRRLGPKSDHWTRAIPRGNARRLG